MTQAAPVIAIDGPSGSGKGTIAAEVAARLGWHLLDSGALYRLVGLAAVRRGVGLGDGEALADLAERLEIRFEGHGDAARVWLDGEEVGAAIRTEQAGEAASRVASLAVVRVALLARQRAFAVPPGLVADGRDMGTVVFPDAVLKVFLTADPAERARRRHKQLKEKGIDVSLPDLSREVLERDRRDSSRAVAPLKAAGDARVVDSTDLTIGQVVDLITNCLAELGIAPGES